MRRRLAHRLQAVFVSPIIRRVGFHLNRLTAGMERGFFLRLLLGLFAVVAIASVVVTAIEGRRDSVAGVAESFGATFYWGVTTVMGSGDASYVTSVPGYLVSWLITAPSFDTLRGGVARALLPADAILYVVKGLGLGVLIGWFCCHHGLSVQGSPTEVPQKSSRAVMLTLLFCVIFNTLATLLYYAIVGSPVPV